LNDSVSEIIIYVYHYLFNSYVATRHHYELQPKCSFQNTIWGWWRARL